jgi:hypothetical protein
MPGLNMALAKLKAKSMHSLFLCLLRYSLGKAS